MGRPVILSNGALTVGLNEYGLVHDFYYPYVGMDNLTTARSVHHKIGVWVDGTFSWVDGDGWDNIVEFEADALISSTTLDNKQLGITLHLHDFVDAEFDAFGRTITVTNNHDKERNIRLFMHQVFQISRAGRADTALFVPGENYILDYKGYLSLLIYGHTDTGSFDQFAIGNYGIEGKQGTFLDAEDGELSGNAVEHGGVDSVARFSLVVAPNSHQIVRYWIAAGDSQAEAEAVHSYIKNEGLESRERKTRLHWHTWLDKCTNKLHAIDPEHIDAVKRSLLVIKSHIDVRGGIIASCDSSIYNYGRDYYSYVWPRDGAYAIWPLIRLGYTEEARNFFLFCRDVIKPGGYLMHKYQPDRAVGSTWHPLLHGNRSELAIQEDETASIVFMIGEYHTYSGDKNLARELYVDLIRPAANFMAQFIDETGLPHASYDLWEEKFLTNTYTAACTYQALLVAVDFADEFGYTDDMPSWKAAATRIADNAQVFINPDDGSLRKGFLVQPDGSLKFDNTLDVSSFYGAMMFDLFGKDTQVIHDTITAIETKLLDKSPSGGTPRYENDYYFKIDDRYQGNPWFVTTLWLAQYYIRTRQEDKARHYLSWAMDKRLPSGVFPEQINPVDGSSISVAPLVWSHAEFINTVLDLGHRK